MSCSSFSIPRPGGAASLHCADNPVVMSHMRALEDQYVYLYGAVWSRTLEAPLCRSKEAALPIG